MQTVKCTLHLVTFSALFAPLFLARNRKSVLVSLLEFSFYREAWSPCLAACFRQSMSGRKKIKIKRICGQFFSNIQRDCMSRLFRRNREILLFLFERWEHYKVKNYFGMMNKTKQTTGTVHRKRTKIPIFFIFNSLSIT